MKITQITYGSKNAFGQGSEESLHIVLDLDEKDNVDDALDYAKNYVLENLNSLQQYNELEVQLDSRKEELKDTNQLIKRAKGKLTELDSLLKQSTIDEVET